MEQATKAKRLPFWWGSLKKKTINFIYHNISDGIEQRQPKLGYSKKPRNKQRVCVWGEGRGLRTFSLGHPCKFYFVFN